jgi:hypothetical protein
MGVFKMSFHVLHSTHSRLSPYLRNRFTVDHNQYLMDVKMSYTGRFTIHHDLLLCYSVTVSSASSRASLF